MAWWSAAKTRGIERPQCAANRRRPRRTAAEAKAEAARAAMEEARRVGMSATRLKHFGAVLDHIASLSTPLLSSKAEAQVRSGPMLAQQLL